MQDKFEDMPHFFKETIGKGHGKIETRRYMTTSDIGWLGKQKLEWADLTSVGIVESIRTIKGKSSCERRCFISSLPESES